MAVGIGLDHRQDSYGGGKFAQEVEVIFVKSVEIYLGIGPNPAVLFGLT